jgi:hypothetical protein
MLSNNDNTTGSACDVEYNLHSSAGLVTSRVRGAITGAGDYALSLWSYGSSLKELLRLNGAAENVSVNDNGTMREVGYRFLPYRDLTTTGSAAQADNGEGIFLSGASFTLTLGALTDTTIITLFNVTATRTIAPGSGTLNWMNGSGTVGTGNRTLAVAAVATVFRAAGNWYIFGTGIS